MALLSTLKVLERATIRKERKLPAPGEVLVQQGDIVSPDTVIAKAEFVRGNPYVVDLRSELRQKIEPDLIDRVLIKKQGDAVKAGEAIARYQKSFWSEIIEVRSPCDGVIEYISRTQGRVIIREDPRSAKPMAIVAAASKLQVRPRFLRLYTMVREGDFVNEGKIIASTDGLTTLDFVYAPISGIVERICTLTGTITIVKPIRHTNVVAHIPGKVSEIIPNYGAVIDSEGAYIQGVFGIGPECFGELMMLSDSPEEPLKHDRLDEGIEGKVLACGSFASFDSIQEAREKGALGLITGGMNQLDLVRILGREISVGLTGHEDTNFTIVILEGFGKIPMSLETWNILVKNAGEIVSIDGTTQIRAGVVRPEIIICSKTEDFEPDHELGESPVISLVSDGISDLPAALFAQVNQGDRVRCTRPPYFGLWGIVEHVSDEPEQVECEAVVEVAKVRLDDGRLITVPQANLEIFCRET